VSILAKRISLKSSAVFIKRFEQATTRSYGYLVVNQKSTTLENDRLRSDIFEVNIQENMLRKQINMDTMLENQ
jgi:hypothetical protein